MPSRSGPSCRAAELPGPETGPSPEYLAGADIPLLRRFPALARIPRLRLADYPTPVTRLDLPGALGAGAALWVKRDDLSAPYLGGNKVRALEFLLAEVRMGDDILTLGGAGSTHVLATAWHAARLGARTRAVRWPHDMNPVAAAAARHAAELCARVITSGGPVRGMCRALLERVRGHAHWIPIGGTSPLGMLGHVNAGLELAEQIARGELPCPARVVLPLGSGGTAAGLSLGLAIAGVDTTVVGARVAPWVGSNRARVLVLARAAARLIARISGERVPSVPAHRVRVAHDTYGGAYGRPAAAAAEAKAILRDALGVPLDDTYSAKAFAAALAMARAEPDVTLFWLTFDGRWMGAEGGTRTAE